MKTDLLLLTLLYVVALAAFVGAINSRGPARVALSYFLAILCLCAAVFHTSQYLAAPQFKDPTQAQVLPAEPVKPPPPPPPDTAGLAQSRNEMALAQSRNDLRGVLESAQRVSRNLGSLNLARVADISDEEYEVMQNRAAGYLSEARRVKEKLGEVSASAHPQAAEAQAALARGVENLLGAASNAERFFKSENDDEEKERLAAFRRGSSGAVASLRKAGTLLGAAEQE